MVFVITVISVSMAKKSSPKPRRVNPYKTSKVQIINRIDSLPTIRAVSDNL